MKILDLFAGAGGWDLAVRKVFGVEADGVEIMDEAVATREAAGMVTVARDVRDVSLRFGEYEGLIASPPCQTFSMAGSGAGRRALDEVLAAVHTGTVPANADERTRLVLEPLRLALAGRPAWIAWEQVPPVLPVWQACADVLRAHGYSVWTGVLRAEQYGVPQTRRRAVLIARRDGIEARPPVPTHSRFWERTPDRLDGDVSPWVSMETALGWTPGAEVISNYGTGGDPAHRGTRLRPQPSATVTEKIGRNKVWYQGGCAPNSTVRTLDQPAPAIAFGNNAAQNGWIEGHGPRRIETWDGGSRAITAEEAAALQTFPTDHPFQGMKGKRFLQIGNAVPPMLAEAILKELIRR